jgi:hypothetical protein
MPKPKTCPEQEPALSYAKGRRNGSSPDPEAIRQDLERRFSNVHFFTLNEAADILHISYYKAYRKVLTGELCGCLIMESRTKGAWRLPKAGLFEFLDKQGRSRR